MLKRTLLLLIILNSFLSVAQKSIEYKGETINALDKNGKHTGIWKLYDDKNGILVVCEFKNGEYVSDTRYYKNDTLIASFNNRENRLAIYKDSKTITASFIKKEDKSQTLIGVDGKELDSETLRYFYRSSEVLPLFYGGVQELYAFIGDNFNSKGHNGRVKVQFTIDVRGYATDIKIMESSNPNLDEEARRIVAMLPRWQPGIQGGSLVKCLYSIPININ